MNKLIVILLINVLLAGCAVNYTFEGKKYNSEEKFHTAVNQAYFDAVARIKPLPEQVSSKKLIFGIPTISTLNSASNSWYQASNGSFPSDTGKRILENINAANYRGLKVFYEAVVKRNIYREVQLVDLNTMNGSIAPSPTVDVIYMVEPTKGSGQWFFASQKRGKQIFAFDRSAAGIDGKVNSFIEAIQVQAVQD